MAKRLIVNDGRSERALLLVANMVVGRDPMCEISDDDSLLSRRHAEFVVGGADVLVRDLGSRNGVYVNGLKVAERPLRSNDIVRIGHLELRYVEDATPLASAVAAAVADSTAFVPGPAQPSLTPAPASMAAVVAASSAAAGDDEERTRLVRSPVAPLTPVQADQEYTRAVKPPTERMLEAPPPAVPLDDEDRTRLVRGPVSVGAATLMVPVPPPAEATPFPAATTPPTTAVESVPAIVAHPSSGAGFVFAHVVALALIVSVAAVAPFLVKGESPFDGTSFAGPGLSAAVIVLTTYGLGARIAGRMRAAAGARDRGSD